MLRVVSLLVALAVMLQPATTVDLGMVERDLTGDGKPEILRVVAARAARAAGAVGPALDNLEATFTIESGGRTIYLFRLEQLQRARVSEFSRWFFADEKFQRPAQFVDTLGAMARLRVPEIPSVIDRDRQASETRNGSEIWEEILKSPVTIFTFSPGGDTIVAIGWSAQAGRFYRLVECC